MEELEKLREHLFSEKECETERLIENLEDSSEFGRGRASGYIAGIQEALDYIRNRLKYGDN